jgi:hypothetical protein
MTMEKAAEKKGGVAKVPDCHTNGADPIGYETVVADAQDCQDCGDKATCLMDGIASGLIKADLGIDPEVKALAFGLITPTALRKRLEIRAKMRAGGRSELAPGVAYNDLPDLGLDELSNDGPDAVRLADEPVIEVTADDEKEDNEVMPKNKKKPKKSELAKAIAKAAKVGKPAKAAKPFKAREGAVDSRFTGPKNRLGEKGYFKYPGKAKVRADGSVDLPNGRTVAGPGTLAAEQMQLALGKLNTKLGLPFDVEIGQTLAKQFKGTLPDGTEGPLEVKIVKDGFATNGNTYTSLSGAVQARLWRSVRLLPSPPRPSPPRPPRLRSLPSPPRPSPPRPPRLRSLPSPPRPSPPRPPRLRSLPSPPRPRHPRPRKIRARPRFRRCCRSCCRSRVDRNPPPETGPPVSGGFCVSNIVYCPAVEGWIVNVADATRTQAVDRDQVPCFHLSYGPVFEVWLWHREIRRWVVMTTAPDPAWVAQGVLSFKPGDVSGLRHMIIVAKRAGAAK